MSLRTLQLVLLMWLGLSHVACMSFHRGALPGEPKDASFKQLDTARVRYLDEGEGPAVVLIHGFAASMDTWKPVVPSLVGNHRVIALDLKGFGWTDRPEGDYSPAAQAALVLTLLDELGVKEAAVVAHSWGSSVALALALAAPERVTKIALYDAWVYEEQLPTTFLWARAGGLGEMLFGMFYKERPGDKMALAFYDQKYVTHEFVQEVAATLDRPGTVAAALAAVRGQRYAEVEDRYSTIRQETLLLWGREDRVTTVEVGERLSRQLPHARLVVYPRCGHFPMIEAHEASTRELVTFLDAPATAQPAKPTRAVEPEPEPAAEPATDDEPESDDEPEPASVTPTPETERRPPRTPYDEK